MNGPTDEDQWELLLQTTDDFHLQLIRSLLDFAQIPYLVQGQAALSLYPLGAAGTQTTHRMLGASLRVPHSRLEEAQALIREPTEEAP